MTKSLLETILDPSKLSVLFQPIFEVQNGIKRLDSLEALIRGPQGTNINRADILFDYVRRKKAEVAVDHTCFMAVCDEVMRLPAEVRVNVNVHAATLGQSCGFVEFFRRCAKKRSLKLERFTIEIVEHAPSCDASQLTTTILQLRELGIRIALDDVGLGQSNYRMMLDCDPEYFKLDGYFVRNLNRDPKRRAVVASLVALSESLESAVVAEAVGSQEDLSQVAELGVNLVQANILCPAMPLAELQKLGYVDATPDFDAMPGSDAAFGKMQNFDRRDMRFAAAAGQSFYT
jgi:EAL domain-containing protein (putative c-di-GMP-specific phosphodiesterase class I)